MQNANQNNARLELIRASEIEPKEIEWLWYPFIPFGKVTLLQGDPGDGKSTLDWAMYPQRGFSIVAHFAPPLWYSSASGFLIAVI